MKPRVVHIIDRLPPDGAERLLCEVLRYRSDAFDYQVLCLAEGGVFEPVIRAMGVPVTILGKSRGIDLRLVWRLWRWLRACKPQIVHTHLFTADTWGRLVARLAGVPLVFSTVHSVNSWQGRVHRLVDRTLALVTTRLIACTAQVADKLHKQDGINATRIVTLANGVDLQRFADVTPVDIEQELDAAGSAPWLAVLGRLEPVKGQAYLLECLALLRDQGTDFRCVLIGDGPERDALVEQVARLQLTKHVWFAGFRDNVPAWLAAIDVLVMPSRWEGLPMALLEAMALGKPIVAHAVGGIPDVVRDGQEGLLVAPHHPQQMMQALGRLLGDAALREQMGAKALSRVRAHYSAEALARAYEKLYQDAMTERALLQGERE